MTNTIYVKAATVEQQLALLSNCFPQIRLLTTHRVGSGKMDPWATRIHPSVPAFIAKTQ